MKPFITIAQARTVQGAELTLHEHDSHHFLRVNGQPLMGTNAVESEKMLAKLACDRLNGKKAARVLIGGLGFGFSLRTVLECVGPEAVVDVAELLPEVVAWNREFMAGVNGLLLDDPRVRITTGDVFRLMTQAPAGHYDAILLDVDNGPMAMVQGGNARLYQDQGFTAIAHALKPRGRVTFWSASEDAAFTKRLGKAGFKVEVVAAKAYPQARRAAHTIFVADRRS
ncbi:MAG: spermine synthase [Verrucomicrobiaceae bacterium]|nr:spermine synthase [Verrucomicrobiaceae bacterium]